MPDIGATLREARMRARIDISEIESATKIRAKYLRALENEEWDLLPGPTYVKSFLRTYAEALGLDARLLVDDYKLRHERLSDIELQPISPPGRDRDRRRRPGPRIPRAYVVWAVLLALLAGIYVLDRGSNSPGPTATTTGTPARAQPRAKTRSGGKHARALPRGGRLQLVATGAVYVCLKVTGGRTLINGATLAAGGRTRTFRAARLDLTLGNSNVRMTVNGRTLAVPPASSGVGYRITRRGRRPLAPGQRPVCA